MVPHDEVLLQTPVRHLADSDGWHGRTQLRWQPEVLLKKSDVRHLKNLFRAVALQEAREE